jgi:GAF domain-containing protein
MVSQSAEGAEQLAGAAESGIEPTQRRNDAGCTWAEQEQILRDEFSALEAEVLEQEIERQHRAFMLYTAPNPAADRRQQLFNEAYAASGGLQRERFVEVARKTWT